MTTKKISYKKTKKYIREDEYFRRKDEELLKKLLEDFLILKKELSVKVAV
ncbi:MAG: hypothetical protein ACOX3T_02950 [Bdellovibrionota bacterium]